MPGACTFAPGPGSARRCAPRPGAPARPSFRRQFLPPCAVGLRRAGHSAPGRAGRAVAHRRVRGTGNLRRGPRGVAITGTSAATGTPMQKVRLSTAQSHILFRDGQRTSPPGLALLDETDRLALDSGLSRRLRSIESIRMDALAEVRGDAPRQGGTRLSTARASGHPASRRREADLGLPPARAPAPDLLGGDRAGQPRPGGRDARRRPVPGRTVPGAGVLRRQQYHHGGAVPARRGRPLRRARHRPRRARRPSSSRAPPTPGRTSTVPPARSPKPGYPSPR